MANQLHSRHAGNLPLPQMPDKRVFANRIRKYIEHSAILFNTSHHDAYRSLDKLHHLDMCRPLKEMCTNYQAYSLRDIIDFTMLAARHLKGILPAMNNSSYCSSQDRLQEILDECRLLQKSL